MAGTEWLIRLGVGPEGAPSRSEGSLWAGQWERWLCWLRLGVGKSASAEVLKDEYEFAGERRRGSGIVAALCQ